MPLGHDVAREAPVPVVVVALAAGEVQLALAPIERRAAGLEKRPRALVDQDVDRQAARLARDVRGQRQELTALVRERRRLLALSAYVARQSRGEPIEIAVDERTRPFLEAGRETFFRRQGQLNFACAQCHNDNWSGRLAGAPITQAQPTGYPLYRLEWQSLGSLQRRLRNCIIGMRVEPYAFGASEYVDLELYLMWRARGLKLESPAVRP